MTASTLRFGVYLPPFGPFGDPHVLVDVAVRAEAAGWDGVFLWDHVVSDAGAIAGAVFGVLSAWPWLAIAVVALTGVVVTATGQPDLPPVPRRLACPEDSYTWSTDDPTRLFVRNEREEVVDVYWVRPDGERDFLALLRPGEYLIEGSYVGHRFVATTERGTCLDVFEAR